MFVYCILGAELTLQFNGVRDVYALHLDCAAEVLSMLIGGKCLIWSALKPDREADPLILLVQHPAHRVPVSWPYAGVDLQGVFEVLRLGWAGPPRGAPAAAESVRGDAAARGGDAEAPARGAAEGGEPEGDSRV